MKFNYFVFVEQLAINIFYRDSIVVQQKKIFKKDN